MLGAGLPLLKHHDAWHRDRTLVVVSNDRFETAVAGSADIADRNVRDVATFMANDQSLAAHRAQQGRGDVAPGCLTHDLIGTLWIRGHHRTARRLAEERCGERLASGQVEGAADDRSIGTTARATFGQRHCQGRTQG